MSQDSSSTAGKGPMERAGWAGETGDFDLTESQVRGIPYVGEQPTEGWANGGVTAYPYQLADKDPDAPLFEGPYRTRLDRIIARYPTKRAALLPVLNLAQEIRGHLSQEAMERVAEVLELDPTTVRGVATFYTMYNKRPVGRYLVQVCTNVACNLCGAEEVFRALLDATGTEPGGISDDGQFTVIEAECLGACGFPTAIQINNRYFENVELSDVPDLIAHLKQHGVDPADGDSRGPSTRTTDDSSSSAPEVE